MSEAAPNGAFLNAMFNEQPAGTFRDGYVFKTAPDLTAAQEDPANGYWHCDVAHDDSLTWDEKVYELFGVPSGTPVERDWALTRYSDYSRQVLERVRNFGLNRDLGFIIDAQIDPEGARSRWIRVLAVPVVADGRVVALHGVKRAI